MKKYIILCFTLISFLFIVGCSSETTGETTESSTKTYTLSLATWGASSHPQVELFTKKFMETVEKNSNGQIKFKYFPDGQMIKEDAVQTAVPDGTIDISLSTLDSWAGRNADVSISATPLWTIQMDDAKKELVPGRPVFDYFDNLLQKEGAKLLTLFDIGPGIIETNIPVKSPTDLKGKTIRAFSKGTSEIVQALGASPVILSKGDVYSALQRGTVDGAYGGLSGALGTKDYEVVDYLVSPNGLVGSVVNGYVMNLNKFNQLPKELQDVIMDSATTVGTELMDKMLEKYEAALKEMEKNGVEVSVIQKDSAQWKEWEEYLSDFKEKSEGRFSPKIVELLKNTK
jgi:TRAP-type C4-dicarboxylate transport system substrate-binding protein